MTSDLRKAAQDVVDAFTAPSSGFTAPWMGRLNAAFDALRAALQSCPDCGKPTPEGSIHTCSPQKPDSDAVCEWTYIGDGSFDSPCGVDYDCDMVVHPSTYMNFCCGCGKRIRFIDAANQGEQ